MLRKLVAAVCLAICTTANALDLDPYVFSKVQAGQEQTEFGNHYSASGLLELGIQAKELPDFTLSYQYVRLEEPTELDLHFVGISYKFYKVWE
jgi:hypothetical protein